MKKIKGFLSYRRTILSRSSKTVLLIVVVAISTLVLSALISFWLSNVSNIRLPSVGTIKTLGIEAYSDKDLLNQSTEIPWGMVHPGLTYNATLFLRSISDTEITLQITTDNWTLRNSGNKIVLGPAEHTDFMYIACDHNGSMLNPGQVIQAVFTLNVENSDGFIEFLIQNDVSGFSFDIDIRAVEG